MIFSTDRILTSHAGCLPRPASLNELVVAKAHGKNVDEDALGAALTTATRDVVQAQIKAGIDIVNDGEISKLNFTSYAHSRIGGYEMLPADQGRRMDITSRDQTKFSEYFVVRPVPWLNPPPVKRPVCVDKLTYVGQADVRRDIDNMKAALKGVKVAGAYMSAVTPGAIDHWMANRHYKTERAFLEAIGEVMRQEYLAIIESGLILQLDAPDLLDAWNCLPDMTVPAYRKYIMDYVEVLNHAIRGIPREKMRIHVCWGSYKGPHHDDIPLRDMIDILFKVNVGSYSLEAASPGHEHEWNVFETVKLPDGCTLMPGVVGHCCDFIEHPDSIAGRLVRYANLLGRENIIANTDCGLGNKVGHASVNWSKFEAMAEGARRASKILWNRA